MNSTLLAQVLRITTLATDNTPRRLTEAEVYALAGLCRPPPKPPVSDSIRRRRALRGARWNKKVACYSCGGQDKVWVAQSCFCRYCAAPMQPFPR